LLLAAARSGENRADVQSFVVQPKIISQAKSGVSENLFGRARVRVTAKSQPVYKNVIIACYEYFVLRRPKVLVEAHHIGVRVDRAELIRWA
jgi:hypothetical protein